MRTGFGRLVVTFVLAGAVAAAAAGGAAAHVGGDVAQPPRPGYCASCVKAVILAARADDKGVITARWRIPSGWCSYFFSVLTAPAGGRIYAQPLKCSATSHTTTEGFSPGSNNEGRTLYVRIDTIRLTQEARSLPAAVKILPRTNLTNPPAGGGVSSAAAYDGSYEVFFTVTSAAGPIPKVGQKLGPLALGVKTLKITGDITGTISKSTGRASGPVSILGLSCLYDIGFTPAGKAVTVSGNATCNNGAVVGTLAGSRTGS